MELVRPDETTGEAWQAVRARSAPLQMLHPSLTGHLEKRGPASAATAGELDSQPPHPSHLQSKPSCMHFLHSAVEHTAHSHRGSGSPHMKHMALSSRKPFDSFHTKRAALSLLQSCAACRVISLGSVTGLVRAIHCNSSMRSSGMRGGPIHCAGHGWSQHGCSGIRIRIRLGASLRPCPHHNQAAIMFVGC